MKIAKIELYNLASLAGEQVIDFEAHPLADADLYSIVGDTGSGKSTILDAVCLALYGMAPRFESAMRFGYYTADRPNNNKVLSPVDPRNILRKGTKECYAQVTFGTDDGGRYCARWGCVLKRTNYSSVERRLERLDEKGVWQQLDLGRDNKRLDRIIGLDYGQFTRTVMLAQNSFANFIKAKDDEKALLLERLTGTEIYARIAACINESYVAAKGEYEQLQQQCRLCLEDQLAPEVLQEKNDEMQKLTADKTTLENQMKELQQARQWYERKAELDKQAAVAGEAYRQSVDVWNGEQPQVQRLALYDCLSPLQSLYDRYSKAGDEIADLQVQIEAILKRMNEFEREHQEKSSAVQEAATAQDILKREWEDVKPSLNKAREDKVRVEALHKTLEMAAAEEAKRAREKKDKEEECAQNRKEREQKETLRLTAHEALERLSPHESMIKQAQALIANLQALLKEEQANRQEQQNIDDKEKEQERLQPALQKTKKEIDRSSEELAGSRRQLQESMVRLSAWDVNELQRNCNLVAERKNHVQKALEILGVIEAEERTQREKGAEYEMKQKEQQRLTHTLEQREKDCNSIKELLPGLEEAYSITMSQNLIALRGTLADGKACPLCGATHHPYRQSHNLEEVMESLQRDIAEKREHLRVVEGELEQERKREKELLAHLNSLRTTLQESRVRLQAQQGELQKITTSSLSLTGEVTRPLLEELQQQTLQEEESSSQQLEACNRLQASVNSEQQRLAQEEKKLSDEKEAFNKKEVQWNSDNLTLGEQKRHLVKAQQKAAQELAEAGAHLTLAGWSDRWIEKPQEVIEAIDNMRSEYDRCQSSQEEASKAISALDAAYAVLEGQLDEAAAGLADCIQKHQEADTSYTKADADYALLFGRKEPDIIEKEWQERLEKGDKLCTDKKSELHVCEQNLKQEEGRKQILAASQHTRADEQKNLLSELEQKLEAINKEQQLAYTLPLLGKFFATGDNWPALRSRIDALRAAMQQARGSMENAQKMVAAHLGLSSRPTSEPAQIESEIATCKGEQDNLDEARAALQALLQRHSSSVERMQEKKRELDEKQQIKNNWEELNNVMGSADGNNFRETAQCYTLQFLVTQANAQLALLNRRYSLRQVPDSLGMVVIDHDRGDEERNLSSLSGGETFIVSLGLALALSSLSSHHVSIKNLFIDEGFGTLDSGSLGMVLDALSNFHSLQGRRVGVISHTPEMRERIAIQIRVVKCSSDGSSRIEVLP